MDYVQALRDERRVYLDGALVSDVTEHPAFRGIVSTAAALYDHAAAPKSEVM
ncbi:MAG: 4-hydroxyphenylacetate 3-hydroxylase N-terminal domain-containing protein [Limisphaerales bacterium]